MASAGRVSRTPNALKQLVLALATILVSLMTVRPAAAENAIQQGEVASIPDQTAPPGPSAQEKPAEMLEVEAAMGRSMAREYSAYVAIAQYGPNRQTGFAGYLQDQYSSKRLTGIVLVAVVAPILASLTAVGAAELYLHGVKDDGGFCNHVHYNETFDEYQNDCKGDRGEVAGIALISSIGGLATLGVLIPGAFKVSKYNKRLRRIEHLAVRFNAAPGVVFSYALGPGDVALGIEF